MVGRRVLSGGVLRSPMPAPEHRPDRKHREQPEHGPPEPEDSHDCHQEHVPVLTALRRRETLVAARLAVFDPAQLGMTLNPVAKSRQHATETRDDLLVDQPASGVLPSGVNEQPAS
jgi:hypothetical protein